MPSGYKECLPMPLKRANDFTAYEDGERTGRGRGCGDRYQPWLRTSDVTHSSGSRCRMYSAKCGRVVHLLSHAEHKFFVYLDWLPEVVEIQEQFLLDPKETQVIAQSQGVRHPGYSFGGCVMTTDFRARWKGSRGFYWTAFQVKSSRRDVESRRTQEKLEIERILEAASCALGSRLRFGA